MSKTNLRKEHESLKKTSRTLFRNLISSDKFMEYVSMDISYDQTLSKIGVNSGHRISIEIQRGDGNRPVKIAINKNTDTISKIKKAIQREYDYNRRRCLNAAKRNQHQNPTLELATTTQPTTNANHDKKLHATHDDGGRKNISWRYIWKTYILEFNGIRLTDDNTLAKDYGITQNNSILKFSKKYNARSC